jgi:hypothetical protein
MEIFLILALLCIIWELAHMSRTLDKVNDKLDGIERIHKSLDTLDDIERKLPKPIRPDYSNGPID